jgi:hypothetical protein
MSESDPAAAHFDRKPQASQEEIGHLVSPIFPPFTVSGRFFLGTSAHV